MAHQMKNHGLLTAQVNQGILRQHTNLQTDLLLNTCQSLLELHYFLLIFDSFEGILAVFAQEWI